MAYPKDYTSNVFINCPFDNLYQPIFDALVFAIHDCGFIARCAKEVDDSGDVRITKIIRIINECKFGIHDISKADLDLATGLARFNMPLELGIFIGCHQFSVNKGHNKEKRSLIMDIERYRYRNFISDLSGQDIKSHDNNPEIAIQNVRDFLVTNSKRTSIAGSRYIIGRYDQFRTDLPTICAGLHKDITELTFIEFSDVVTGWISKYPIS